MSESGRTSQTAKGGIASLTLVQAAELRRYGITANALAPSARTGMTAGPFGERMKTPEDGSFDHLHPGNVAPLVVWLSAPGFAADPGKAELTAAMLRITFPYVVCISLVALSVGILTTWSRFGVPAITPPLLNLSFIAAAAFFVDRFDPPVMVLAWAVSIGGLLQLALSRAREYDADLDGATLTGDPEGLASALALLERKQGGAWEGLILPGSRLPEPSILRTHPKTANRNGLPESTPRPRPHARRKDWLTPSHPELECV